MPNQTRQLPFSNAPVMRADGSFSVQWYLFFQAVAGDIPQVGDCLVQAAGDVTDNYLACAGAAISRTTYANLFAVIGTDYGVGDGVTTFNLPTFVSPGAPSFWKIRYQ